MNNSVRTTKYTYWNFLFLFLFYQFRSNLFNFFFLCGAFINLAPQVHVYANFTIFAPLVFVLAVAGIREFAEDQRRRRQDKLANSAKVQIIRNGAEMEVPSAQIWPGDLVVMTNDQDIPADVVVLATSDPAGLCYVQTTNLDGESNLKARNAVAYTQQRVAEGDPKSVGSLRMALVCEAPNADLTRFNGNVTVLQEEDIIRWRPIEPPEESTAERRRGLLRALASGTLSDRGANIASQLDDGYQVEDTQPEPPATIPLSPENVLLRGCRLRNTAMAVGVAVYCGHQSKVFMNQTKTANKLSTLTRDLNRKIVFLICCHLILCFVCALCSVFYTQSSRTLWYLPDRDISLWASFFLTFFTYAILFGTIIPISLFVSMDVARFIIARLIERDEHFELPDATPERMMAVRSSNLMEELGYVGYLLTDKTGTLTENEMVADTLWTPAHGAWRTVVQLEKESAPDQSDYGLAPGGELRLAPDRACAMHMQAQTFCAPTSHAPPSPLLEAIAVCHQVQISSLGAPDAADDLATAVDVSPTYCAESPDELALVELAAQNGYVFSDRRGDDVVVTVPDGTELTSATALSSAYGRVRATYRTAAIFGFNSDRKRMAVLVHCVDNGAPVYRLFMKGADSAVLPRCTATDPVLISAATAALDAASLQGLRTLCFSCRTISRERGDELLASWASASGIPDPETKAVAQAQLMAQLEDEGHELLGVSAIEDRLQDGVPRTLAFLREAGVRPWMLTGDKLQTAINIARSARLIEAQQRVIAIVGGDAITRRSDVVPVLRGVERILEHCRTDSAAGDTQVLFQEEGGMLYPRPTVVPRDSPAERKYSPPSAVERAFQHVGQTITNVFAAPNVTGPFEFEVAVAEAQQVPAVVVDGAALGLIFEVDRELFVRVASQAGAVVVCRASPLQKAQCVQAMRDAGHIVAAVGDGANDVSMIQVANVGIGVAGREGLQASRVADFSISRFRHLNRLLAVHGRYSYHRMVSIIHYSIYKNLTAILCSFLLSFNSLFSGTTAMDSMSMMLFNIFFSSLPILAVCCFDRDLPEYVITSCPSAYRTLQQRKQLAPRSFVRWIVLAVINGVTCYYFTQFGFLNSAARNDGRVAGLGLFNILISANVFGIITIRVCLEALDWTWPFVASVALTLAFYFGLQYLASGFTDFSARGDFAALLTDPGMHPLWWQSVFVIAACSLPAIIISFCQYQFHPTTAQTLVDLTRCKGPFLGFITHSSDTPEARWRRISREIIAQSKEQPDVSVQNEDIQPTPQTHSSSPRMSSRPQQQGRGSHIVADDKKPLASVEELLAPKASAADQAAPSTASVQNTLMVEHSGAQSTLERYNPTGKGSSRRQGFSMKRRIGLRDDFGPLITDLPPAFVFPDSGQRANEYQRQTQPFPAGQLEAVKLSFGRLFLKAKRANRQRIRTMALMLADNPPTLEALAASRTNIESGQCSQAFGEFLGQTYFHDMSPADRDKCRSGKQADETSYDVEKVIPLLPVGVDDLWAGQAENLYPALSRYSSRRSHLGHNFHVL